MIHSDTFLSSRLLCLGRWTLEASSYRDCRAVLLTQGGILEVSWGLGEGLLIPGIPVAFLVCSSGSLTLRPPCTAAGFFSLFVQAFPLEGKELVFVQGQVYLSDWFFASDAE